MTLLMHDGFDDYDSTADQETRGPWDVQSSISVYSTFPLRPNADGKYARLNTSGELVYLFDTDQSTKTLYIGAALYFTTTNANQSILNILEGTTTGSAVQLKVINDSGTIKVYRGDGTTLLGTGIHIIEEDTWYYFEFKINIHNITGSFELKFGTSTDISLTNIDTQEQATDSVQAFEFKSSSNYLYVDDVYCCNGDGSLNNTYLGEVRSKKLFPSGDDTVAWSRSGGATNAENVDETFDPDNDTSYVYSTTASQQDLYTMPNLTNVDSGIVYGVRSEIHFRKYFTDWHSLKFGVKYSTTEQLSAEKTSPSAYVYDFINFETSDGSTTAWTETTFNSMLYLIENQ